MGLNTRVLVMCCSPCLSSQLALMLAMLFPGFHNFGLPGSCFFAPRNLLLVNLSRRFAHKKTPVSRSLCFRVAFVTRLPSPFPLLPLALLACKSHRRDHHAPVVNRPRRSGPPNRGEPREPGNPSDPSNPRAPCSARVPDLIGRPASWGCPSLNHGH